MLALTLPHVDAWNSWYAWYGNSPQGFAKLSAKVEGDIRRSACVLVAVDGGTGERPPEIESPHVDAHRLAEHLAELADAGADEAILVLDPITERSVIRVAELVLET